MALDLLWVTSFVLLVIQMIRENRGSDPHSQKEETVQM